MFINGMLFQNITILLESKSSNKNTVCNTNTSKIDEFVESWFQWMMIVYQNGSFFKVSLLYSDDVNENAWNSSKTSKINEFVGFLIRFKF